MSLKGKTLVKGHTLYREGARDRVRRPCCDDFEEWYWGGNGPGHGVCSCDAISPHLPNKAARKRWHKEHKAEMVALSQGEEA